MKLLLDTHVLVWCQADEGRLGPRARRRLQDASAELFVSAISALELGQLVEAGRLELDEPVIAWFDAALVALGATGLPMTAELAADAYGLPGNFHRDPADRVLVATARALQLTLLTADDRILEYEHVHSLEASR